MSFQLRWKWLNLTSNEVGVFSCYSRILVFFEKIQFCWGRDDTSFVISDVDIGIFAFKTVGACRYFWVVATVDMVPTGTRFDCFTCFQLRKVFQNFLVRGMAVGILIKINNCQIAYGASQYCQSMMISRNFHFATLFFCQRCPIFWQTHLFLRLA